MANTIAAKDTQSKLHKLLPIAIFLFFVFQPLIDIASYWLRNLDSSGVASAAGLIRLVSMILIITAGIAVSPHKKNYLYLTLFISTVSLVRFLSNNHIDISSAINDTLNTLRWLILPFFTLSLVDLFRYNKKIKKYALVSLPVALMIIVVSIIAASATKTMVYTYTHTSTGYLGWFSSANAQGMILTLLAFAAPIYGYKYNKSLVLTVSVALAATPAYLLGTRVAYYGAVLAFISWLLILFLGRSKNFIHYIIFAAAAALMVLLYPMSPMSDNRSTVTEVRSSRDSLSSQGISSLPEENFDHADGLSDTTEGLNQQSLYSKYVPYFMDRFGFTETLRAFDYTDKPSDLIDYRISKTKYAVKIFQESNLLQKIFGHSYSELKYKKDYLIPEQDIALILVVYGIAGLATVLLYFSIGMFILVILSIQLIRRRRHASSVILCLGFLTVLALGLIGGHLVNKLQVGVYWSLALAIPIASYLSAIKSKQ